MAVRRKVYRNRLRRECQYLAGAFSFCMREFKSISDYATDDVIIRLLAKERGKFTAKNGRKRESHEQLYQEQLKPMMPPRAIWTNPGKSRRPQSGKNLHGLAAWTGKKRMGKARVYITICKELSRGNNDPWAVNLRAFIQRIQEILNGTLELKIEKPEIIAKFKEQESQTGHLIYRPISAYRSLETKILVSLAYNYLLYYFDGCFHSNMLFMRSARKDREGRWKTPNYLDAIRLADAYRRKHDRENIYVGECDIQKFYDIFNHDDILECFEELFKIKKAHDPKIQDIAFDPIRRLIKAYLDSYDYKKDVIGKNDDPEFWLKEKQIHATPDNPNPICRFKWVKPEAFLESGCYASDAEFQQACNEGKIGVPQGGALSGMIVNVVMNVIDSGIVDPKDPGRFFVRYCNDILLMHTDKCKCEQYLDYYEKALTQHKLLPHKMEYVSQIKNGAKTTPRFWHSKSKHVYLWGRGADDASDWVGFVGFEMRRTGEIRVRKDKIDTEAKRIARTYYSVINSNHPEKRIEQFGSLPGHIRDFELITVDRYTIAQAKHLDNYLSRKIAQAARKTGAPVPEGLTSYQQELNT